MTVNQQTLSLDVSKRAHPVQQVTLGQGDHNGTVIAASIYDAGEALSLTGYSVYVNVILPDGVHVYRKQGSASDNVATFTIDEREAASVPGVTHDAYVTVESGDSLVCSTGRFAIAVKRGVSGLPPSSWFDGLAELEGEIADAIEEMQTQTERARVEINAAQAVAAGYVVSVGGNVDGETLVLASEPDVDALATDLAAARADITELETCCEAVNADLTRAFLAIAALTGSWQYVQGNIIAPNAEAMSVTSTTATIDGTISGTAIVLQAYTASRSLASNAELMRGMAVVEETAEEQALLRLQLRQADLEEVSLEREEIDLDEREADLEPARLDVEPIAFEPSVVGRTTLESPSLSTTPDTAEGETPEDETDETDASASE